MSAQASGIGVTCVECQDFTLVHLNWRDHTTWLYCLLSAAYLLLSYFSSLSGFLKFKA